MENDNDIEDEPQIRQRTKTLNRKFPELENVEGIFQLKKN